MKTKILFIILLEKQLMETLLLQDQNHILEVSTYLKVYLILEEKLILFVKAIILIKSLKFRREKQHLE